MSYNSTAIISMRLCTTHSE